ncbi:ankyrin repeat domain-containing protein [Flavobacterium hungaricum]|uniref:Ankyrin repeat domain-containing protein n=1 Tax=Flavobacterium hungaricum TaxID=2082725 RepID=A0ABR9TH76_9FLAO|nr:ankyrin repeat domain-containing protein [Flavobacterium hungaricum]MBE8724694.1 ankyrin repeat domain-containing protein [Flavobacterium hungaricum]
MKIICFFIFIFLSSCSIRDKEKWDDEKEYWSPLMHAVYNNDSEELIELINRNADVNFIAKGENTGWELTVLDVALFMNNNLAAEKILSTGKVKNINDYMIRAASEDNEKTIQLLIDHGADPNASLENGYTALMSASSFGSIEVLNCLLKNKANPNLKRRIDQMTALELAETNGDAAKVKLLLKYGAVK